MIQLIHCWHLPVQTGLPSTSFMVLNGQFFSHTPQPVHDLSTENLELFIAPSTNSGLTTFVLSEAREPSSISIVSPRDVTFIAMIGISCCATLSFSRISSGGSISYIGI